MVLLCCNWCFLDHDEWSRNFLKELWGVGEAGKGHHWSIWQLCANFQKHLQRHHKYRVSIQWVIGSGTYVIEGMGNMMYVMIYVTEGMGSMTWAAGIQVSRRKMELGCRRKNKINTQICLVIEPFFRTASFFLYISQIIVHHRCGPGHGGSQSISHLRAVSYHRSNSWASSRELWFPCLACCCLVLSKLGSPLMLPLVSGVLFHLYL